MKRAAQFFLIAYASISFSAAQTGGDTSYDFLNLSSSSIISSLGGKNVSLPSDDPSLLFYNPALLEYSRVNSFAINYVNYFAGINYGSAIWASTHPKLKKYAIGLTYLNYGKFDMADPTGALTGEFKAAEYALHLIWNYRIDSLFNAGIDIKPIISHLESYTSFGMAADLGVSYKSRSGRFSSGLAISNLGFQIKGYTNQRERLPVTLTAGMTLKPEHAPFRLSLTAHHLEKYDLIQNYFEMVSRSDENITGLGRVAENVMRHIIVGVEFLPSENFFISTGFNYQRRKELSVDYKTSTVGFSTGFGIRLTAFDLTYSRSKFHLAGSLNNLSLMVKPDAFIRRK